MKLVYHERNLFLWVWIISLIEIRLIILWLWLLGISLMFVFLTLRIYILSVCALWCLYSFHPFFYSLLMSLPLVYCSTPRLNPSMSIPFPQQFQDLYVCIMKILDVLQLIIHHRLWYLNNRGWNSKNHGLLLLQYYVISQFCSHFPTYVLLFARVIKGPIFYFFIIFGCSSRSHWLWSIRWAPRPLNIRIDFYLESKS